MVIVVSSDESWAQRLVCNTCRVDGAILCTPNTAAWTPAIWWPEYQEITLKLPSHARTEAQWKVWHASRPVSACQDFCTLGNLHTSSTIAVGDISIYRSDSITGQVGNARLAASLLPVNRLGAWLYYICLSFLVQDCQKTPQACIQPRTCITMILQQRKIVPSCYSEQKGDIPSVCWDGQCKAILGKLQCIINHGKCQWGSPGHVPQSRSSVVSSHCGGWCG